MPYNGWSNYETWNIKLWIDNEEPSYNYWREQVRDAWEQSGHDKDATINDVSHRLENEHKDNAPELQGTYSDLLSAALSEVDWYEIAESMVNDEELPDDGEKDN